jgi:hypothetical protein
MRISPLALRGKARTTSKSGGSAQPEPKAGPGAQRLDLNLLGLQYMKDIKDRCGCLQVVCARGMNNNVSRFVEGAPLHQPNKLGLWKLKRGGLLERVVCGWEHQRGCWEKWRHKMNDYP